MNVRMMLEGLAPGVKHAEETDLRAEMPGVPDITAGTGTESDETPGWWWPVGLSQSEGAHEMAGSVDGALSRVPGHLGVGRPSIYTTASGRIFSISGTTNCEQSASSLLYDLARPVLIVAFCFRPWRWWGANPPLLFTSEGLRRGNGHCLSLFGSRSFAEKWSAD
jgi:hypothetical protein